MGHEIVGKTPGNQAHEVVFVVNMKNADKLADKVHEVSDPSSDKYLQHWSKTQVDDFIRNEESTQAVKDFIKAANLVYHEEKNNGGAEIYLYATGSVDTLETLLKADFHDYRHKQRGTVYTRSLDMTMPSALESHVFCILNVKDFNPAFISGPKTPNLPLSGNIGSPPSPYIGDNDYPRPARPSGQPENPNAPYIVANWLNSYLGISDRLSEKDFKENVDLDVSLMVFESDDENYQPLALSSYISRNSLVAGKVEIAGLPGYNVSNFLAGCGEEGRCAEANLDVQMVAAIAQGVKIIYYSENVNATFLSQWSIDVATMESPPDVVSISYGAPEIFIYGNQAMTVIENNVLIMNLRGVSVFASSGDLGAPTHVSVVFNQSTQAEACAGGYQVNIPSSYPFVTAAGGTMGPGANYGAVTSSIAGKGVITSGGGFSILYNSTSCQKDSIAEYLKKHTPPSRPRGEPRLVGGIESGF
jgi:tripeptidyl-peptidase-1